MAAMIEFMHVLGFNRNYKNYNSVKMIYKLIPVDI
jgi:hypothetical protein